MKLLPSFAFRWPGLVAPQRGTRYAVMIATGLTVEVRASAIRPFDDMDNANDHGSCARPLYRCVAL